MSWVITGVGGTGLDVDAAIYIAAVESADGQALEAGVKWEIDQFIRGCKADGIWSAIKASCILAGARTLNGALVPLVGTAPTNNNFVSGDYDRKTGLAGNASTKYINTNRNNNADPQNSQHLSAYVSVRATSAGSLIEGRDPATSAGLSGIRDQVGSGSPQFYSRSTSTPTSNRITSGSFVGISRSASGSFDYRINNATASQSATSTTPPNVDITVFATSAGAAGFSNARMAFYSIGESLNLSLLDARVSTLIAQYGRVIA